MNSSLIIRLRPAICSLTVALAPLASGANIAWSLAGTGPWNNPANWTGGVLPAATNASTDVAQINNGGTATVGAGDTLAAGAVSLGTAAAGSGNVQITGGTLTSLSTFAAGAVAGSTGSLDITGGALTVNTSDLRIGGNGTNATGTMTISAGTATMSAGNFNIGFGPASASTAVGTVNVSGTGSILVQNPTAIMAVGNRGNGTVNQTGGSVELRSAGSVVNLGRNGAGVVAAGTYNLSGGTLSAERLQYGNNNTAGFNTGAKNFNLSGTGILRTNTIFVISTASTNQFNFTGGQLAIGGAFPVATGITGNVNIPLVNAGGVLSPTDHVFSASGFTADATGTLTFGDNMSYTQSSGTLAIDIDGPGSNDLITLGIGASTGTATIAGDIFITMLSGYDPAPGTFFDIVKADTVTSTATITGTTISGFSFVPSEVIDGDGREVLRLTVVPEPAGAVLAAAGALGLMLRRRR